MTTLKLEITAPTTDEALDALARLSPGKAAVAELRAYGESAAEETPADPAAPAPKEWPHVGAKIALNEKGVKDLVYSGGPVNSESVGVIKGIQTLEGDAGSYYHRMTLLCDFGTGNVDAPAIWHVRLDQARNPYAK